MTDASPRPVNRSSEEMEMRALIVPELRKRWPAGRVIHELPLRYSTVRIDLATVTPEQIVAVEIKSSLDVLDRLERQVRGFLPISERVIVALAPSLNEHWPAIEREKSINGRICRVLVENPTPAQRIIRDIQCSWLGVWTVDAANNRCEPVDPAWRKNTHPWPAHLLDMLHVAELREIASRHRIVSDRRSTHEFLKSQCAELMTGREVRRAVCGALRARDAFSAGTDAPITDAGPE